MSLALPPGEFARPPGLTIVYGAPLARSASSPFNFESIKPQRIEFKKARIGLYLSQAHRCRCSTMHTHRAWSLRHTEQCLTLSAARHKDDMQGTGRACASWSPSSWRSAPHAAPPSAWLPPQHSQHPDARSKQIGYVSPAAASQTLQVHGLQLMLHTGAGS